MAITKRAGSSKRSCGQAKTQRSYAHHERALRTRPRAIALAVGTALLPWTLLNPALAGTTPTTLPTGVQTIAGSATVTTNGTKMQIDQSTGTAILGAQTWSIGSDAWVNMTMPGASSTALVRVLGSNPSEIFGRWTANGQVFLTNPNGVLFGRGASVEVGSLFATTLSIADKDFLAGRYNFYNAGGAGSVINEGHIVTANGYAALAGPQVRNDGIIVANAGTVALAAGDRVSLDMIGDGLIRVSVDQAALNASAINAGSIQADGGRVLLTAHSANALLDTVVNNSGIIRAQSLVARNGEIVLDGGTAGVVSNTGTLAASGTVAGTTGGTVKVLGQNVGLSDGSTIDASGDAGGGIVLVGGALHGAGTEANAAATYVAKGATINADAITSGDGGKVVVWSDHQTVFAGAISARGGSQAGNGGFVEVSGKDFLSFRGTADRRAAHGAAGTLLLDPTDLTITALSASSVDFAACSTVTCAAVTESVSTLNTADLDTALLGGPVNVNATTGPGSGAGTINWNDGSVNAHAHSLMLTGSTSITFNGTITNVADLAFVGATPSGSGSATSSAGGAITGIGAATFNLSGANAGTAGGITFNGFNTADSTTITGAVNFNDTTKVTLGMTFASAADVTGMGNITGVAGTFHLSGVTTGDSINTGIVYHGFTTADAATITGAVNFDDTAKSSEGMGFANATNVTGSGTIANVVTDFDDTTLISAGSAITYSAGFTAVTTTNNGDVTGTASFTLTGNQAGNAASVRSYTGFGSSSSAATVTGALNFDDGAKSSEGMTFGGATSVTGAGNITNVAADYNDATQTSSATGITYSGFGSVAGTLAGDITNTASFALTGANQGSGASGQFYTGFGAASAATTIAGALNFDDTTKVTHGMAFAGAADVTGTGNITGVAGTFHLSGVTMGDSVNTGIVYHGFTTADAATVTGAVNFDDTAKSSEGMGFANATNVTGSGTIANVVTDFDDVTLISAGSAITYSSGFMAVTTANNGDVSATASFALTGNQAGNAASVRSYTGFGSSSSATTVTGALNFDDTAKSSRGMTFAAANSVTGTGTVSNVVTDFNDATLISAGSGITYSSGFTAVTTTNNGDVTGTASFALTANQAGNAASGRSYTGFGSSSSATTVAGAVNFNDTTKVTQGMVFASAADVTGTGNLTGVAGTFHLSGVTRGDSTNTGIVYQGFTTADAATITGAVNFDDTAKSSEGMTFGAATSVTGAGTLSNVVSNFDDTTLASAGSGITYSSGFTAANTANNGDVTGTASFALTGNQAGNGASGRSYTGFGSSSSATTITGALNFNDTTKVTHAMTFASAADLTGTGSITGVAGTFHLSGVTTGDSISSGIVYHGFTSADAATITGAVNFDDAAKSSEGVTVANATSVTGTGTISNVLSNFNDTTLLSAGTGITYSAGFAAVNTANNGDVTGTASLALTGTQAGNATSGRSYTGFGSSSSATTISGAVDFDDTAKLTRGMTFAAATGVTGIGTISNIVSNFNDTTLASGGSGIIYSSGFTAVTTANSGDVAGTASFALTGNQAGNAASGRSYVGFGSSSSAATVTGAVNFVDTTRLTRAMTFASAADVTGTGNITGVAGTFHLSGVTTGDSINSGIVYHGFTTADAATITGAVNFDDTTKTGQGVTFGAATSVTGTGTIGNVAGGLADNTLVSTASGIDYAGFSAVTGTGTSVTGVAGSFNDTTKVSAASGVSYSGFAVNTVSGTGANVAGVTGGFNVSTKVSSASGISYGGFNVGTVSGAGAGATITGSGQTYTLTNATPNAGASGSVSWTSFPNVSDATGVVNFQSSGSVSGNVTAQSLNYGTYSSPVTLSLSGAAGTTTGIGGTRTGVSGITGSGNSDTITGSGATYNLTAQNAGNSAGLSWASFENISDAAGGTFNLAVAFNNVTGTIAAGGTGATLNSSSDITGLNLSVPSTVTMTGTANSWNLTGAPQPALFQTTNANANVTFNGACIGGPACGTVITIVGSISSTVSQIASQALKDAQSTDSVAKQIDYGFAGDVGTTPPMDHRIDETGISTPDCLEESREARPCKN
jgi:filamentous hemagglutinin family protein